MKSFVSELIWSSSRERKKPPLRYDVNLVLLSQPLIQSFVLLHADDETLAFLNRAKNPSAIRGAFANCLRAFLSRTTANGLAGRGGMFVLSSSQARDFLSPFLQNFDTMLDIGAGDGGVTQNISKLFRKTYATEDSTPMRWRLWMRGYSVLDAGSVATAAAAAGSAGGPTSYDLVCCLNVLDRADKPLSLLRSMRDMMRPGSSYALLAVVLPWCPFVEDGAKQKPPSEPLPMDGGLCCKGATFEASLQRLVDNVLVPCGFEIVKWARVPYLCEGSPIQEYYKLDDAILLMRRTNLAPDNCER